MIEKIKTIKNPLTIVGIFSGIAEISITGALIALNAEMQSKFIWFVIGFPILLVLLFFITLNLNAKVLYSPHDFKDEKNFLNTISGNFVDTSLYRVEINKDNYKQYIENKSKLAISPDDKEQNMCDGLICDEEISKKANELLDSIEEEMAIRFEDEKIISYCIEVYSTGFYRFQVMFAQTDKSGSNRNSLHEDVRNYLIHVYRNEESKILFEVMGGIPFSRIPTDNINYLTKLILNHIDYLAKYIYQIS